MKHPHSGEQISDCLQKCLKHWNIYGEKMLLLISDNGENLVKDIKLLGIRAQPERDILSELENGVSEEQIKDPKEHEKKPSSEDWKQVDLIVENVAFRGLGCLAHGIQLVVKLAYEGENHGLLLKTHALVGKIRKSSVTSEKMVNKNCKTVTSDCSTKWNSNYGSKTSGDQDIYQQST